MNPRLVTILSLKSASEKGQHRSRSWISNVIFVKVRVHKTLPGRFENKNQTFIPILEVC